MTPRSIRRAAERKAAKLARKAERAKAAAAVAAAPVLEEDAFNFIDEEDDTLALNTPLVQSSEEPTPLPEPNPISDARLAANRANAQKSSGPVTDAGKAVSRLNAIKTGLTGVTVLFPNDDVALYGHHIKSYELQFEPVGPEEKALVQSIADLRWRLNRVPGLEQAILSTGSLELIKENPSLADPTQHMLLELHVRRAHEKELRNLHLQENRLARRREREAKELARLQESRKAKEQEKLEEAAKADFLATRRNQPLTHIPGLGFDFTLRRYRDYLSRLTSAQLQKWIAEAPENEAEAPQTQQAAA